jgi:hypothetical protein
VVEWQLRDIAINALKILSSINASWFHPPFWQLLRLKIRSDSVTSRVNICLLLSQIIKKVLVFYREFYLLLVKFPIRVIKVNGLPENRLGVNFFDINFLYAFWNLFVPSFLDLFLIDSEFWVTNLDTGRNINFLSKFLWRSLYLSRKVFVDYGKRIWLICLIFRNLNNFKRPCGVIVLRWQSRFIKPGETSLSWHCIFLCYLDGNWLSVHIWFLYV